MNAELKALDKLVQQMSQLLAQLSPVDYSKPLDLYDGSSIGKHFRHIHDFFHSLNKGLERGVIDYGLRERNPELEQQPQSLSKSLIQSMANLSAYGLEHKLSVVRDVSSENTEEEVVHFSSLGREILFVHSHTVHHLAIIKMGVKALNAKVHLNDHFGVAPSTVAYQASKIGNG